MLEREQKVKLTEFVKCGNATRNELVARYHAEGVQLSYDLTNYFWSTNFEVLPDKKIRHDLVWEIHKFLESKEFEKMLPLQGELI